MMITISGDLEMRKRLSWSEFVTLLEEDPGATRSRQRRNQLVLLGQQMGATEPSTDKREKHVYLQPDVLLTRVTAELAREGGLEWSVAANLVHGFWHVVLEKADLAEVSDPAMWVAIYSDREVDTLLELDVGTFEELSPRLERRADSVWRVALVNLTRLLRGIRERAKKTGIELEPWFLEPTTVQREALHVWIAERRQARTRQEPKVSGSSKRS
jgi:hypothetical protein